MVLLCALSLALFLPAIARAAVIEFETSATSVGEGSEIVVSVFLNADELVSAVDMGITIPEAFEYQSVSDGSSLVSFWVDQPTYASASRVVSFSGIVPGGYAGQRGKLVDIRLRTPRAGAATIALTSRSAVFLHGPDGTRDVVSAAPLAITVVSGVPATNPTESDTEPPEPFLPTVSSDPSLFNGQPFVMFATQDKGSGIDRYEIQERSIDMVVDGAWRAVESPALLDDASRQSYIFVRAIDRAGNIRIIVIAPEREGSFLWVIAGLLFGALMIALLISVYNRRYRYAPLRHDS